MKDPSWLTAMGKLSAHRIREILEAPHDDSPADLKMLASDGKGGLKRLQLDAAKFVHHIGITQGPMQPGPIQISWSKTPVDPYPRATARELDPGPLTTMDVPHDVNREPPPVVGPQQPSDNVVELHPREPEPVDTFNISIDPRLFIGPP
jgi:hypothetical protein